VKQETIKVSVVITSYNRADAALLCVRSVLASDFALGMEVIVVDDCSTKCAVEEVFRRELPNENRVRVIRHERNMNAAASRNTGARAAIGQYVFFLDDDNELSSDTLRKLVAVLDAGEYALAAPLAVNVQPSGEKTVWASSFAFSKWMSIPRDVDAGVPYTETYAKSMVGRIMDTWYSPNAYMIPRALFEKLGGFDAWFGMYMEESDLGLRVLEAGHRAGVVGDAVTWHRHYNDVGDMFMRRFAVTTPSKAFRISRNRLHFAWRHYSLPQVLSILVIFAPLVSFRYFVLSCLHGWPKIGLAFLIGYGVGAVQVIGRMLRGLVVFPFSSSNKNRI